MILRVLGQCPKGDDGHFFQTCTAYRILLRHFETRLGNLTIPANSLS